MLATAVPWTVTLNVAPAWQLTSVHPVMTVEAWAASRIGVVTVILVRNPQSKSGGKPVISTLRSASPVLVMVNVNMTGVLVDPKGSITSQLPELFVLRLNEENKAMLHATPMGLTIAVAVAVARVTIPLATPVPSAVTVLTLVLAWPPFRPYD